MEPLAVVERRDEDHAHRRAVRAWCLYDWANSSYATTITVAVLPAYYHALATRTLAPNMATAVWGYAVALSQLLAAIGGPLVGTLADRHGRRKGLLIGCVAVGAPATVLLALVPPTSWPGLIALFGVSYLSFALSVVLYDSLLPSVARADEMDRVSTRGFALGYIGGGLLLALNLAWIVAPRRFGLPDADAAMRLSFVSVGLWWGLFTLPLARHVAEPPAGGSPGLGALARLADTVRELPRHPELLRFLVAFWLYSDGIGTVMRMATVYGSEVGIDRGDLIGALLMVQIVAAPASLAFGRFAERLGPQRAIVVALAGYGVITVAGYFMSKPWHFWAIAALVALFQGGAQALSRSLFARLAPPSRRSSLFGFYSVSEKLAGVVGPVLFGVVAEASGSSRLGVLTLLPFFAAGAWLLLTVDLERGAARAAEK